jgi:hypothetical protein
VDEGLEEESAETLQCGGLKHDDLTSESEWSRRQCADSIVVRLFAAVNTRTVAVHCMHSKDIANPREEISATMYSLFRPFIL